VKLTTLYLCYSDSGTEENNFYHSIIINQLSEMQH